MGENYYQIEIPLQVTSPGAYSEDAIWPKNNMFDIEMQVLTKLKAISINNNTLSQVTYYDADMNLISSPNTTPYIAGKNRYAVKGNPSLGKILSMMIGVKNA